MREGRKKDENKSKESYRLECWHSYMTHGYNMRLNRTHPCTIVDLFYFPTLIFYLIFYSRKKDLNKMKKDENWMEIELRHSTMILIIFLSFVSLFHFLLTLLLGVQSGHICYCKWMILFFFRNWLNLKDRIFFWQNWDFSLKAFLICLFYFRLIYFNFSFTWAVFDTLIVRNMRIRDFRYEALLCKTVV